MFKTIYQQEKTSSLQNLIFFQWDFRQEEQNDSYDGKKDIA